MCILFVEVLIDYICCFINRLTAYLNSSQKNYLFEFLLKDCRTPNLGSSVYHVSVPGSVADMHNSDKIDIKNHTLLLMGKNILHGSGYIAWATGLTLYIIVLRQRSYDNVVLFLQAIWSANITLD
jgi:hypothetical protein